MVWTARFLLFIPSLVAGWFVSREDPRFWVIALVVALVFLVLTATAGIYMPTLRPWSRKKDG